MVKVLIVGGGPAGLLCAEQISKHKGFEVHIIDHKKAFGRKFLVAGDGGLNLSNNLPIDDFVSWYSDEKIKNIVQQFTAVDLCVWFKELGIETYYGSSGKLFPKVGIKPIDVLNAILNRLKEQNVIFHAETKLLNWQENVAYVKNNNGVNEFSFDVIVFAMGGGSWSKTGSDGNWLDFFKEKVKCHPFKPSNAGVEVVGGFNVAYRGQFLKNVNIRVDTSSMLGELRFTEYGLEGIPIYALNSLLSDPNKLYIDFKPNSSKDALLLNLKAWKKSRTDFLKCLKLGFGTTLIKDSLSKQEFQDDEQLVNAIKNFTFDCIGLRPLEEAISSKGGVDMDDVDANLESIKYPNVFFIGEMLDWDTRTGGFLLQACFSSGYVVSQCLINRYVVD